MFDDRIGDYLFPFKTLGAGKDLREMRTNRLGFAAYDVELLQLRFKSSLRPRITY